MGAALIAGACGSAENDSTLDRDAPAGATAAGPCRAGMGRERLGGDARVRSYRTLGAS